MDPFVVGTGLDDMDKVIMAFLQQDGRIPYSTIATALGVASGTIGKRVKRLEKAGYLQIVGVTDPFRTGLDTVICLWVKVQSGNVAKAMQGIVTLQEVRYTAVATGAFDLIVIAVLKSRLELLEFLNTKLSSVEGVRESEMSVILEICKQTYDWTPWPLPSTLQNVGFDDGLEAPQLGEEDGYTLDYIDKQIIAQLQQDGRYPYGDIAFKLDVAERTIRRRVADLKRLGILRIVGVTDPIKVGMSTVAIVGVKLERKYLTKTVEKLTAFRQVRYVAVCTGVYNIMFEVVLSSNRDLFSFLVDHLSNLEGIIQTDTSLVLDICKQRYSWGTG